MTEAFLIAWITKYLGVKAYGEKPAKEPAEYVTIERTGGGIALEHDTASFAVQCWAKTNASAAKLAHRLALSLPDLEDEPQVCECSIESVYRFDSPDSTHTRYQITLNLSMYTGVQ